MNAARKASHAPERNTERTRYRATPLERLDDAQAIVHALQVALSYETGVVDAPRVLIVVQDILSDAVADMKAGGDADDEQSATAIDAAAEE